MECFWLFSDWTFGLKFMSSPPGLGNCSMIYTVADSLHISKIDVPNTALWRSHENNFKTSISVMFNKNIEYFMTVLAAKTSESATVWLLPYLQYQITTMMWNLWTLITRTASTIMSQRGISSFLSAVWKSVSEGTKEILNSSAS
jgi:hypothetical protein